MTMFEVGILEKGMQARKSRITVRVLLLLAVMCLAGSTVERV